MRIGFVPGHANGEAADKEFTELDIFVFGAEEQGEIDGIGVGGFGRMKGDGVFLFEDDFATGGDEFNEGGPLDSVEFLFEVEQTNEALAAFVFFPVVEPVDAMETGEDTVLPWVVVGPILGEDAAPGGIVNGMKIGTKTLRADVSGKVCPNGLV